MNIFELSSATVDDLVALDPLLGTMLGIATDDGEWSDLSPAGIAANRRLWTSVLEQAQSTPVSTRTEQVAQQVLVAECERNIRAIDAGLPFNDLNNIASPWQMIRDVFDLMADDTADAWDDIISRLSTIEKPLTAYRETLEEGRRTGRTVARRQVLAAIEQGHIAAGDESAFNQLLARFDASAAADSDVDTEGRRARLATAIDGAKNEVRTMTQWFETDFLPEARPSDAVGRDAYIAAAEQFLGETIDPETLYGWGWQEIARLRAEIEAQCAVIDPHRSVAEVMDMLNHDPDRGVDSVDSFLQIMQERQEAALSQLDGSHFDVPSEIRRIEVKASPPGGALAPYYTGPSEDFTRPGRVWYPIGDRTFFPLYDEVSTAYHEGFPGHHLQIGWQTAMGDDMSRFHRMVTWYPGSGEGWALYAEHLMGELGFLEKPDYVIGMLAAQMFRSCRIVIDVGMHCELAIPDDQDFHPGETWSFALATELLRTESFAGEAYAESEVTRYFGWPGQAISYKVGEKAIHDLRAELEARPGFDLKKFHADLLSAGSVGLDLLRELVTAD